MRQNLGWAVGYNAIALPIAAGVFELGFGLVLRPEVAALPVAGSSFTFFGVIDWGPRRQAGHRVPPRPERPAIPSMSS